MLWRKLSTENPRPGLVLTHKFGCDTTLGLHSYQICCISYILVCILSGVFNIYMLGVFNFGSFRYAYLISVFLVAISSYFIFCSVRQFLETNRERHSLRPERISPGS